MADLKLIKTSDISRVPIKSNQLIFVDDGSMYFDYSNTIRLHNSGGAHLENYVAGKEYLKYDMCVYRGLVYRATVDCLDYTFVASHWQLLTIGSEGGSGSGQSSEVQYDNSTSGLSATTVQQAIDELVSEAATIQSDVKSIEDNINSIQEETNRISESASQSLQAVAKVSEDVVDLSTRVDEHIDKAITTDSVVTLDTF